MRCWGSWATVFNMRCAPTRRATRERCARLPTLSGQTRLLDTRAVITELGVGEALVSTLDAKGVPDMVDRCLIRPPTSRIGPITAAERAPCSPAARMKDKYDARLDRESAAELLLERAQQAATREQAEQAAGGKAGSSKGRRSGNRDSTFEAILKNAERVATPDGEISARLAGILKLLR